MLYFVNGVAVSSDQFVARWGVIACAIILGPGFTLIHKVCSNRTADR
jgi:hypothetical protein